MIAPHPDESVNILLVDDQAAKLLSYEAILKDLGENLLKANSAQEAFEHLLKTDIAVVLVDVFMPDLDGFELARMIREHPRFQKTAIIFISAVLLTDLDFLQGYRYGAVDYLSVPVIPEILRAKVKVFTELYRKTRQLERLNRELEQRIAGRTAELEASTAELRKSEERLRLAFDAAQMGWWEYDATTDRMNWSSNIGQTLGPTSPLLDVGLDEFLSHVHPDDGDRFRAMVLQDAGEKDSDACELRFLRPDGSVRWCLAVGQLVKNGGQAPTRCAGVALDITSRKQIEERQQVLVRELDHRAKNLLAVVQSVVHLSRADTIADFVGAVEGRIAALSRAHSLLSESRWEAVDLARIVNEEIAPFTGDKGDRVVAVGPSVSLQPRSAQSLALALHEMMTNAVKYGALSVAQGDVRLEWELESGSLVFRWIESGGPATQPPSRRGFGTKLIAGSIEHELSGRAVFEWLPGGLRCTLIIPRSSVDLPRHGTGRSGSTESAGPQPLPVSGKKILVVEDELLVGMMIRDILDELGFTVLGPVPTVAEALAIARDANIDGAILDVNIRGDLVYSVADVLSARGIPFVFATGYLPNGIDSRYAGIPVFEKPVSAEAISRVFASSASAKPPSGSRDRWQRPIVAEQTAG